MKQVLYAVTCSVYVTLICPLDCRIDTAPMAMYMSSTRADIGIDSWDRKGL